MNCKFCAQELPEGQLLCPNCGGDNQEETVVQESVSVPEEVAEVAEIEEETPVEKKKLKKWQLVAIIAGGVVLLAVLVGAVLYGLGVKIGPRQNTVQYKDDYTAADEKLERERDTVIATVGTQTLTNEQLQVYYWFNVNSFLTNYNGYFEMFGFDVNKSMAEQIYDAEKGMTWQQMFLDSSLQSWYTNAVTLMIAEDDNFVMDESMVEYLDNMKQSLEEIAVTKGYENADVMLKEDLGEVFTASNYSDYISTNYKVMHFYTSIEEKLQPNADEVEAYFTENEATYTEAGVTKDDSRYVDVRHILIVPEGGTKDEVGTVTYSDAEWEACKEAAQDLLDQWKQGEATEDSFAELAKEKSEDPGSASEGGLYTQVVEGQMVPSFEEWSFDESRVYGDTGLVKSNYGYHIMFFVGTEEIWFSTAEADLMTERINSMLDEGAEKYALEVNYKKILLPEIDLTAE